MTRTILGRIEDRETTEIDERFMRAHTELKDHLDALSNVNLQVNDVRQPTEQLVVALEELNASIDEGRRKLKTLF